MDFNYNVTVSDTDTTIARHTYKRFISLMPNSNWEYVIKSESYYRKGQGVYYQYGSMIGYSYSNLVVEDRVEFIFLKDNVGVNSTWESLQVSATLKTELNAA